jgi:hypothetical protein
VYEGEITGGQISVESEYGKRVTTQKLAAKRLELWLNSVAA